MTTNAPSTIKFFDDASLEKLHTKVFHQFQLASQTTKCDWDIRFGNFYPKKRNFRRGNRKCPIACFD